MHRILGGPTKWTRLFPTSARGSYEGRPKGGARHPHRLLWRPCPTSMVARPAQMLNRLGQLIGRHGETRNARQVADSPTLPRARAQKKDDARGLSLGGGSLEFMLKVKNHGGQI